jgi:hypothetical protein
LLYRRTRSSALVTCGKFSVESDRTAPIWHLILSLTREDNYNIPDTRYEKLMIFVFSFRMNKQLRI